MDFGDGLNRVLDDLGEKIRDTKDRMIDELERHREHTHRDSQRHAGRLQALENKVFSMDKTLARNQINGGKKPSSATGPNVYAQDLSRARVETAGKIALAVAVALILATLKAL